jgi:hypothetical protein
MLFIVKYVEKRVWYINSLQFVALLWTPPEVLQSVNLDSPDVRLHELRCTTAAGDMYAVGITLKELFTRSAPYAEYEESTSEG